MTDPLDRAARAAGGRIIAALAARYRDLDLAEECFAEACLRAAERWRQQGPPRDAAAWLYRVADRHAVDSLRRQAVRRRLRPEPPPPEPTIEDRMSADGWPIPDERLRLIFTCCHPAVAAEARAALTLRLVCGLPLRDVARAFLLPEPTLAQRLTRAKRKIAAAGIPFAIPAPAEWPDRLDAVLATLEVAYAKVHEDAAGGLARDLLDLTAMLADMLPHESEVLSLAALVRYAEARRPARLDADGEMVPLAEQDPVLFRRPLIAEGESYLRRAAALAPSGPRSLQAALHAVWCARDTRDQVPPWPTILRLYDGLLRWRDDAVVRVNRAVALAEVAGAAAALSEIAALDGELLADFLPYHAVRADLLRRTGDVAAAAQSYRRALALDPPAAERRWLERRLRGLTS